MLNAGLDQDVRSTDNALRWLCVQTSLNRSQDTEYSTKYLPVDDVAGPNRTSAGWPDSIGFSPLV